MLRGENIGMKIRKKFVGKIALDGVPDSADGARAAITNAAQTVSGQKNFHANVSVKQDSSQGNKKLICKANHRDPIVRSVAVRHDERVSLLSRGWRSW